MPAECRFRIHDWDKTTLPSADDIDPVLPSVIPVLGRRSPKVNDKRDRYQKEVFPFNNWLFTDAEPVVVYAPFDYTSVRVREAKKTDLNHFASQTAAIHPQLIDRFPAGWLDQTCSRDPKVNAAFGVVDPTKCKIPMIYGNTGALRVIEYHASKLLTKKANCSLFFVAPSSLVSKRKRRFQKLSIEGR